MRTLLGFVFVAALAMGATAQEQESISPEQYLEGALDELQAKHINRDKVDWSVLRRKARDLARGAKSPSDTYAAIDYVIEALGEKHTLLYAAPKPQAEVPAASAPATPFKMPEPVGELIDGKIGYLRIPAFGAPADHPDSDLFVAMSRRILLNHDRKGACGWILDLRGNHGGNIWPMADGLVPLLAPRGGAGPYWSYEVDGKVTPVVVEKGRMVSEGSSPERPVFDTRLVKSKDAPIAILLDEDTASSAEGIALAFRGLPAVRYFGQPTANFVTVNNPVRLPDGASIQMTVGYMIGPDGKRQLGPITPDEVIDAGLARDAAISWISEHCKVQDSGSIKRGG